MTIRIIEPCAGSYFSYRKGEEQTSESPELIERFKDLIRGGHAVEIGGQAAATAERKIKSGFEKR